MEGDLSRVRIVLVEPQHPGNVGAAARAMKNMGLSDLHVVAPPAYDPENARWMAPGCDAMLDNVRFHATLESALEGCQQVVASTARHRKRGQPVHTPKQLAEEIAGSTGRWALLFGREDFGLSTEHANFAESIVRISTPEHASLNLAQAVLLISHACFERMGHATGRTLGGSRGQSSTAVKAKRDKRDRPADIPRIEPAVAELVSLLDSVGYFRGTPESKVQISARQALQRSRVTVRHVEALRGMVARLRWALEHPEQRAEHEKDRQTPALDAPGDADSTIG